MKESDIEGVATHDGPEPCAGVRKGVGEALAGGVQAGQLSREITIVRGAHAVLMAEGNIAGGAKARAARGPRAVGEPWHVRKLHAREPGEPSVARCPISSGPSGEGQTVSPE
jgi:hypothetical protein